MSHTLQQRKTVIYFLSDDHGPDENSESETVSIKNIQFLTEAENTGWSSFDLGLDVGQVGPNYLLGNQRVNQATAERSRSSKRARSFCEGLKAWGKRDDNFGTNYYR